MTRKAFDIVECAAMGRVPIANLKRGQAKVRGVLIFSLFGARQNAHPTFECILVLLNSQGRKRNPLDFHLSQMAVFAGGADCRYSHLDHPVPRAEERPLGSVRHLLES